MAKKTSSRRILFIDEVRGFDIVLMVCFHAFYTMGWLLDLPIGKTLYYFFEPAQPFFAGLFIFICGICCWFSNISPLRGPLASRILVRCPYSAVARTDFGGNAGDFDLEHSVL